MHVILMSERLGPTRSFSVNLWHAGLAAAILVAALVWSGLIGFQFASGEGGSVAITLGARQDQPQVTELARRVGELQARLARLDAKL